MNNERQTRTPADPQREKQRAVPQHIEPEREQHSHKPIHVSQEEMQKIMPPDPDPDDPVSP